MPSKLYIYKREYYAGRGNRSSYCPFNSMIECAQHDGKTPPNLPDCCTHCGWNPAEKARRMDRLEASINGK